MTFDPAKIDDAALALLFLTLHDDDRAWKGLDWDALNRLHQAGYIYDPINKAKSVVFTPAGLQRAQALAERLFSEDSSQADARNFGEIQQ